MHTNVRMRSLLLFSLFLGVLACSTASPDETGGGPDAGGTGDCEPRTCEGLCGSVADGCGGILQCGTCDDTPPDCVPLSCESNTCGSHADGCGGTLDCGGCNSGDCVGGFCSCANDANEGNNSAGSPTNLGTYPETSNVELWEDDQVLTSGDIDYFQLGADDTTGLFNGNPKPGVAIDASGSGTAIDVTMTYTCHNGPPSSVTCEGGSATTTGCEMSVAPGSTQWMHMKFNCSGGNEDGTAIIEVTSSGAECSNYRLGYMVGKQ